MELLNADNRQSNSGIRKVYQPKPWLGPYRECKIAFLDYDENGEEREKKYFFRIPMGFHLQDGFTSEIEAAFVYAPGMSGSEVEWTPRMPYLVIQESPYDESKNISHTEQIRESMCTVPIDFYEGVCEYNFKDSKVVAYLFCRTEEEHKNGIFREISVCIPYCVSGSTETMLLAALDLVAVSLRIQEAEDCETA